MEHNKDIIASLPYSDKFSEELNDLLFFIVEKLSAELPSIEIDCNYFILGIFNQKKSDIFQLIDDNLMQNAITNIHDSYYQYISTRALSAIKPSRVIHFSNDFKSAIELAEKERENLNDAKLTSCHIFLALLNEDFPDDSKIRKVFNKVGITYNILRFKLSNKREHQKDFKKPNPEEISKRFDTSVDLSEIDDSLQTAITFFRSSMNNGNKKSKESNISQYCTNLNDLVEKGKIDKLIGRDNEMEEIIRILGRKKKNNAILVGNEGVGKTAIGENIAYRIINKEVPNFLLPKQVIALDMTALMAGTTLRGMFEERVKSIIDEIKSNGNYILFIDNIGTVLANTSKNEYDISAMLSHSLSNGEIQVIGTSDFASFRKTFDKDPSLSRLFQKIIVEAPSLNDSKKILMGIKSSYEDFHKVKYDDNAIFACVDLANKYIPERNLPDSAIDLMDEVGSYCGTSNDNDDLKALKSQIVKIKDEIETTKDYSKVEELKLNAFKAEKEYNKCLEKIEKNKKKNPLTVTVNDILHILSLKTGIPVAELSTDDKVKLLGMNERLKKEVIGQDKQIDTICQAIKRNRIGFYKKGTMYSAMIIGKTGTGKTLIAKKLAKEIFGDEKKLIRFDMSEYPDKSAVNKLIGSNPGYIGYEEGGQLTEAIKNKKHCVLLLDEIEKADPEVYNIFLQVLDEGFLTDNSGMKIDFKNVIVLFTSNIGAKAATDFGKGIGFNENEAENSKKILLRQLKNKFPPEFINRLDNVIYFNSLSEDNLKSIIKLELDKLIQRVISIGYNIEFNSNIIDFIYEKIKEEHEYGARPIIRVIQDEIENKIADELLNNTYHQGYTFNITLSESTNQIEIR